MMLKSEEIERLKLLHSTLSDKDSHNRSSKGILKNDNRKDNNNFKNNVVNNRNNNNDNDDNNINSNIINKVYNTSKNHIEIVTKNGYMCSARRTLYILTLTILSANSILKLMDAYQNKKNFNAIFDNVTLYPIIEKINLFVHKTLFVRKIFEFLGNFIRQFSVFLLKIISDFGFESVTFFSFFPYFSFSYILSSIQSLNSKYSNTSSNNNFSMLDLLHADLTLQLQQIIFLISIIIGPFLLFYQFLPLISTSVESAQNLLFMENILPDSSFDSFFSSQNYHKNDFEYQNENANNNDLKKENFSDSNEMGWTIDGPDKGSGVIFKNLTVERDGIIVLNVRTAAFRFQFFSFLFFSLQIYLAEEEKYSSLNLISNLNLNYIYRN